LIVRKCSERDDRIREVIVIPAAPPFLRVLVFFALGGEEAVDGSGRFREGDVIDGEDTDGLIIDLAIENRRRRFGKDEGNIPEEGFVNERNSDGAMTRLRCTSLGKGLIENRLLPISEKIRFPGE